MFYLYNKTKPKAYLESSSITPSTTLSSILIHYNSVAFVSDCTDRLASFSKLIRGSRLQFADTSPAGNRGNSRSI